MMAKPDSLQNRSINIPDNDEADTTRVPAAIYPYSAGIAGGLMGGLAMIPIALAYGIISGRGIWYPINLIAATFIPSWQQATQSQLAQLHVNGLLVGLGIHLLMSIALGLIFSVMLPALPKSPVFWAFVIGPCLWGGAVYAGLPLFNRIMSQYIDLPSFALANIVYSLVLGLHIVRTPKVKVNDLSISHFIPWWNRFNLMHRSTSEHQTSK